MSDIQPKLKKDGTPAKKKGAKTPEGKEKQKATQFKPGNNANKDAWNLRKERREFRKKCADVLLSQTGLEAMVTMLVNTANDGKFKEFMEIYGFLRDTAFGTPGQMPNDEDLDQSTPEKTAPILVIPSDLMNKIKSDDELYS